ncbi:hypothetical protein RB195_025255 [Necator americanus]|uniref:Tas retrotransposon peptidase A16 n=1 Tax=Necator americanus TaxID=51031 RepID=A0ABR1ERI6_NECAM
MDKTGSRGLPLVWDLFFLKVGCHVLRLHEVDGHQSEESVVERPFGPNYRVARNQSEQTVTYPQFGASDDDRVAELVQAAKHREVQVAFKHRIQGFSGSGTTKRQATASTPRQEKPVSVVRGKEKARVNHKPSSTSTTTHQLNNQQPEQSAAHIAQLEDAVAELHSRKVAALLDSGAECFFIDQKLADELCLPALSTTTLRVRTFGSERIQVCTSRKVPLEIWDEEGEPCSLEFLTHSTLTSTLRTPPMLDEDVAFINERNLNVNLMQARTATKSLILLGSDQLWQLIRENQVHVRLPSGLYLLPTRLGHLLTGQVQATRQVTQVLKNGML